MFKTLLKDTWAVLTTKVSSWWLVLLLVPLFGLFAIEQSASQNWIFAEDSTVHKVAQQISKRGDFYNASFALVGIAAVLGWIFKSKRSKLIALSMLLACASSGVLSLGVRVFSGRPRPAEGAPDGLYGMKFKEKRPGVWRFNYGYQSMPSGHTTTAVATAIPVVVLAPAVGVPLTVAAISVAWARFELRRHWLTDLYIGAIFGGVFGLAFGLGARRQLKRLS